MRHVRYLLVACLLLSASLSIGCPAALVGGAAGGAGGKAIEVALKKISPTRTEIRIRVGLFGDEWLSRQILEGIKRRF